MSDLQGNIKKLPVWAQKYIERLESEREIALRKLNEVLDTTTPSAFYIDELECTGEGKGSEPTVKRQYIQAYKISCAAHGIELDVSIFASNDKKAIKLSWGSTVRGMADVAMVPMSFNQVELVAKENMR